MNEAKPEVHIYSQIKNKNKKGKSSNRNKKIYIISLLLLYNSYITSY